MYRLINRFKTKDGRNFCVKVTPKQKIIKPLKTTVKDNTKKYSDTLLLGRTTYSRHLKDKAELHRQASLLKTGSQRSQYKWQRDNLEEPEFVLHDGPPYVNGPPHIGHAINKVLKDIILRYHVVRGRKVHYVPGFDCHGLPIELQAVKSVESDDPTTIRTAARKIAYEFLKKQSDAFSSWWILAAWQEKGTYSTQHPSYVTHELKCFADIYEKGLIFRDFKPVYWSPSSCTALAESELVYKDHTSPSAYVRFRVDVLPNVLNAFKDKKIYAIIWTTTPWTLVANQAIAYASDLGYCITQGADNDLYIIAEELVDNVSAQIGQLKILLKFSGEELHGARYNNPITGESLPFLTGSHVTAASGTGLVHTAPAHGKEDFLLARENSIPIKSLVDEDGCYTADAGTDFQDLDVLQKGTEVVLDRIGGDVLKVVPFEHRYPYDWRTNQPVITRASYQWFFDIEPVKDKAIEAIQKIAIYPRCNRDSVINGLITNLKQRPYWCISRQRAWGTPIPALYRKENDEPIVNRRLVETISQSLTIQGLDSWWTKPLDMFLESKDFRDLGLISHDLKKGTDILDIWFDSGISWSAILPNKVADVYLEGIDQLNGWFQSSLLTSIALQERAPYKALFVHGFAVDATGKKMSKSEGNGVSPDEIIEGGNWEGNCPPYGLDTLRWWVASHACQHLQVPVKKQLFDDCSDILKKFRGTFHFLLGALYPHGMPPSANNLEHRAIDKYMLHCLYEHDNRINHLYEQYEFHHVTKTAVNFLVNTVSPRYINITKDRLYCDERASNSRCAVVDVMANTLTVLMKTIAPIVPVLVEEVYLHHPERLYEKSAFFSIYRTNESWNNPEIREAVELAFDLKAAARKAVSTSSLLKEMITITANDNDITKLKSLQTEETSSTSDLCEILECASVTLQRDSRNTDTTVSSVTKNEPLCPRCRRYFGIESDGLCSRCSILLSQLSEKRYSL